MIKKFENFNEGKLDKINKFLEEIYSIGYILIDENIGFCIRTGNRNNDTDVIFSFDKSQMGYNDVSGRFTKDQTINYFGFWFSRINCETYTKSDPFLEYVDRVEEICEKYKFKFLPLDRYSQYVGGNIVIPHIGVDV